MIVYDTKGEAMKNATGADTVRKVTGGWAVMTWQEYFVWKNQK